MHKFRHALTALALAFAAAPAMANLVYATGTDLNNDGKDDSFTVNGQAAWLVTQTAHGWPALPDDAITTGKYISYAADQSNATRDPVMGANYIYAFQFEWNGADLATTMDFRWISDDYLTDIVLNGDSLGVNNLHAANPWTISNIATGVAATVVGGTNTIEFLVANTGGNQPPYGGTSGATGLAADFTVYGDATPVFVSQVPEPNSLALAGIALAGLVGARRRSGRTQRA